MMSSHNLNKRVFNAQKAAEVGKIDPSYYKTLTWRERLQVANYLNSLVYNYPENEPPKLDRTYFRAYSKEEQDKLES
jgi:hypothetical protein